MLRAVAAVAIEAEEAIRGRRMARRRLELCGRDGSSAASILHCELRSKGPLEPTLQRLRADSGRAGALVRCQAQLRTAGRWECAIVDSTSTTSPPIESTFPVATSHNRRHPRPTLTSPHRDGVPAGSVPPPVSIPSPSSVLLLYF